MHLLLMLLKIKCVNEYHSITYYTIQIYYTNILYKYTIQIYYTNILYKYTIQIYYTNILYKYTIQIYSRNHILYI